VLYGGHVTNDSGAELPFIDTWEYSGGVWTQRQTGQTSVPNPSFRSNAAMATVGGVAALFGGFDDIGITRGDTWTWDSSPGVGWSQRSPTTHPGARLDHAMAVLGAAATLYGGFDGSSMYLGDTWSWDGSAWHPALVSGPGLRAGHSMASRGAGHVVLFGGYDGTKSLADTWEWDGASWSQRATTGPSARQFGSMASR
jgi:hypothetical protein